MFPLLSTDFLCANAGEAADLEKLLSQNGVKSLIEPTTDLDTDDDRESLLSRNLGPVVRSGEQPLNDAISFDKYNRYLPCVSRTWTSLTWHNGLSLDLSQFFANEPATPKNVGLLKRLQKISTVEPEITSTCQQRPLFLGSKGGCCTQV